MEFNEKMPFIPYRPVMVCTLVYTAYANSAAAASRTSSKYMLDCGRNGPVIKKTMITNATANNVAVVRILSINDCMFFESSSFSELVNAIGSVLSTVIYLSNKQTNKVRK